MVSKEICSGLQVVHSKGNHWILASNYNTTDNTLNVYDSVYTSVDKETMTILQGLFLFKSLKVIDCQKKVGENYCGLFSVAAATSILSGQTEWEFCQSEMRHHTVYCLEQNEFTNYP